MFIRRPVPVFAADNDGGAGDGTPPPADTTNPPANGDTAGQDQEDDEDLFGAADQDAPITKDKDGKPVKPDWLGAEFWDAEKGEPRLQSLAKSQQDLRKQISGGAHKPPQDATGYTLPKVEGMPEGLIGGKDDPVWKGVTEAALKAGMSVQQLQLVAQPFLAAAMAKLKDAPAAMTAEQEKAARNEARQAELTKLGPNGAAYVRDVGGWMAGLQSRGLITADELKALRSISTADGIRALGKLRELSGDKAIPVDALSDGGTIEDAKRMMTEGYANKDDAMVKKARTMLERFEAAGALRQ